MGIRPEIPLDAVHALCLKHNVKRLWLFGSAACGDFDPDSSDYDFLVEFLPFTGPGRGRAYFALQAQLEALLGRRVDLAEPGGIRNPIVRASIDRTKVPLYAAA
ncbi:MAG: nucleotidyltransferase domain-containing protein [Planctomycetes bacterium]|nr:nucleotidyltransferase domain-containing protein [Planctomycetota bacterium]